MIRPSVQRGFTLVELLVAMGLLSLVLVLLASMTNSTASSWRFTSGKIEQFRGATNAFEALTRRLSQATLNTYWDYNSPIAPTLYFRQSELRFISGIAQATGTDTGAVFLSGATTRPTDAIFFQAPLGFVDESPLIDNPNFGGLDTLVNTWGYYVEYNQDVRPAFLNPNSPTHIPNPPPFRNRYRLMELMQPSNQMTIYNYTSGYDTTGTNPRNLNYVTNPALPGLSVPTLASGPSTYDSTGRNWFMDAMTAAHPAVHVLAENVIALVLLPKLTPQDEQNLEIAGSIPSATPGTSLSPYYSYDSTASNSNPYLNSQNQLPPVVQVTLVAIDEASANRMSPTDVTNLDTELAGLFSNSSNYATDLKLNSSNPNNLESYLIAHKINYRIFSSDVAIRGAKWSTY
jgi:uncharacterized protein (TIGR02599 family)